jgi:thiosulfate/3-mercaptopyruvate sulfurtransferase
MTTLHDTLIAAADLQTLLAAGRRVVLLDCRFDLADTGAGERAYAAGHLPGAHYLHLDHDLSGDKHDAQGRFRGRHPLPERARFAALAASLGVAPDVQVVAYDAQGGMYAARAWWLLRWIGHRAVAVLDGGLLAWTSAGGALSTAASVREPAGDYNTAAASVSDSRASPMPTIDAAGLLQQLGRVALLDARAPERYRGEIEPLDAAAGHIPGALNRFFQRNLQPDGRFKPAVALRAEFDALLGQRGADQVVHQCGSGVTACHNLLAMEHAGLSGSQLYPGSWSEWSSDPARPVARSA